jgi:tetratricopeptide (TPR) repeat protein
MKKEALDCCSRGNLLYARDRLEEAREAYESALKLEPSLADAHFGMGNVLYDLGRFEEAAEAYARAVRLKPYFDEAHKNLGDALFMQKRYEEALAAFSKAVELNAGDHETRFNRGVTLSVLKRYEEAMEEYNAAIKLLGDNEEAFLEAVDISINRALVLLGLERFEESIIVLDRVIEAKPDCSPAYLNKAEAHICMFDFEGALKTLEAMPPEIHSPAGETVAAFLDCIARICLGRDDPSDLEQLGCMIMEKPIRKGYWLFDELDGFLRRARGKLNEAAWSRCELLVGLMKGERLL